MALREIRGSGRTTRQLRALPIGAVFVSCNEQCVHYDKRLARFLNRGDIMVVAPNWIVKQRWQGQEFAAIEVDHAYAPRSRHTEMFYHYLLCAKTRIWK